MADRAELLAEAYRRGLLPPDKKAAYEQAMARGLVQSKPYTVRGEIEGAVSRLKSDIKTAYDGRPNDPRQPLPANADWQDKLGNFLDGNRGVPSARDTQRIQAADRLGGDIIDVPMSAVRGVVNKYVNKPLSRATGIPEDIIGAAEATAGMMAGAPTTTAALKGGVARVGALKTAPKPAPRPAPKPMTLEELGNAKTAAYKAVDSSGITYRPEAMQELASSINKTLMDQRINPQRHPKAASMAADISRYTNSGHAPSLTELDQLRQVVRRDVANATDEADAHMGRQIIKQIDAFMDATSPKQVVAGSGTNAAEIVGKARDLNTRYRKVQDVTEAVESAKLRAGSTGSGGNVDNAIRQNLRRVLENANNLTPDEEALLRSIVLGDPGQNALRFAGKMGPNGGLMGTLHAGGAGLTGGASLPLSVATAGAKVAADAITERKVQQLIRLMSMGGKLPGKKEQAAPAQMAIPNRANTNSRSNSLGQDLTRRATR